MREFIYPASIVFFMAAALVWPTVRIWRREGVWPVVFHREGAPVQRVLGALLSVFFVGLIAWGFMVAFLDPASLGIISLPPAAATVGWTIMAVGTALVLLAQTHMGSAWRIGIDDRPTELVTSGLFGLCRNPIFTGMLTALAGAVLVAPSPWSLVSFLLVTAGIGVQVRYEERHLLAMHDRAYADYASRVGRFVPFIGRLDRLESSPRGCACA